MLLEQFSRFFLRHEFHVRSYRNQGPPLKLRADEDELDAEGLLRSAVEAGTAQLSLRNGDEVRLVRIEPYPEKKPAALVFLFRRANANAGAPWFEHQQTQALRRSDKADDESVTVSAHLIVGLRSLGDGLPTHPAILEEVPGLGRTYVQAILSDVIKQHKYEYQYKPKQTKETFSHVVLQGLKSQSIDAAMRHKRTVSHVVLVRPANLDGLDTEGLAIPGDERMKIQLHSTPEKTITLLNRINAWRKKRDWKDVRVQLDLPHDRSKLVSIAREADAADVLFVRSEHEIFKNELADATDEINQELVERAIAKFAPARWAAEK